MVLAEVKRYFIFEYIKCLLIVIVLSSALVLVLDFAEIIRSMSGRDVNPADIIIMTLSKSINNLIQIMSLLVLISTMMHFIILGRKNELVIFTTLGFSNSFFISAISAILCMLYVVVITVIMPISAELNVMTGKISARDSVAINNESTLLQASENTFISFNTKNNDTSKIFNVIIWELDQEFNLNKITYAPNGEIDEHRFIIHNATEKQKLNENILKEKIIELEINPRNIVSNMLKPNQLNILSINSFIKLMSKLGFSTIQYERYFLDKISLIINFITMALIGFIASFCQIQREFTNKRIVFGGIIGLCIFFTGDFIVTLFLSLSYNITLAVILPKISILTLAVYEV